MPITKLAALYPDALLAITPHPETSAIPVGANQTLAMACCTIVLARRMEMMEECLREISAGIDAGLPR
jgi:hypothetical protein